MAIQKPQTPLKVNNRDIYPLTCADQVVMEDGQRLTGAMEKFLVPSYGVADYGKILGCCAGGLQWVDSQSELINAEEVAF